MLQYLRLENVGPAPEMAFDFAPRLNLLTGDNGLGKSFVLDVAWWALTGTWANGIAIPPAEAAAPAIAFRHTSADAGATRPTLAVKRADSVGLDWPQLARARLLAHGHDQNEWGSLLPALLEQQAGDTDLLATGRAWLMGREDQAGWSQVWQTLLAMQPGDADLLATGRTWLTGRENRAEWAHVYQTLLAAQPGDAELFATGRAWLAGRDDRAEWSYVWQTLLAAQAGDAELLATGRAWLAGREDRAEWSHVWRRLLAAQPGDTDLLATGRAWLMGREEQAGWSQVWQTLLATQPGDTGLPMGELAKLLGQLTHVGGRAETVHGGRADLAGGSASRGPRASAGPQDRLGLYDRATQQWRIGKALPGHAGLVVYMRVDGGFAVWDPQRNAVSADGPGRPPAFVFTADELWSGNSACEGLVRDWTSWQREGNNAFQLLSRVLEELAPAAEEPLVPGEPRRIAVGDPRDYPTLRMPYGEDVPVVHVSAGMKRIISLAYLLVWTWREHQEICQLLGQRPTDELVLLVDEVETHLHPRWQRCIVPALLTVMDTITAGCRLQAIVATHSPLVLASMEDTFDTSTDQVFDLELTDGQVEVRRLPYEPLGTADDWLTSDAIGLRSARGSLVQEALLEELAAAWNDPALTEPRYRELSEKLASSSMRDTDPVRSRWLALGERRGFVS
ncbi:MAG: AAA family ATPase [Armatimonadetes bacterium]|nr:AAA family ATPase [Armatimonadota bacterium]